MSNPEVSLSGINKLFQLDFNFDNLKHILEKLSLKIEDQNF